jgi:hypothetical protein
MGDVENYGQVASHLPGPRTANSGTGPCDQFDPSGTYWDRARIAALESKDYPFAYWA